MEFLKNNARFSFRYGEKDGFDCLLEKTQVEQGNELVTTYLFEGGLKITNVAKKYDKYGAYEWVNWLENTSDQPTPILSELWDCDCTLPMEHEEPYKKQAYFPDEKKATKIYAPMGSNWSKNEFFCNVDEIIRNRRLHHIVPEETKFYTTTGGRSSETTNAPFFRIQKNEAGYIMAIGWTGQWNAKITRGADNITLCSKIEDTYFRLLPHEKIRTSSVVIMPFEGDAITAQNKWRRLVKEHFSLVGQEGRDAHGPLCAGVWGGMKSQSVLERIDAIRKNQLPFEYVWMDAGWYGSDTQPTPDEFEGDWAMHTGDWCVSPLIHPNGLTDVSRAIHDAGMKFILWFEPERVIRTTPTVLKHPEYFLAKDDPNDKHRILNLGNEEAWQYCFDTLSYHIDSLGVDFYRQDFNTSPLPYWRKHDDADRKGITEIKHINGLYRLWDALLERFPHLLIDNCASGGRRIDIETLRRSMPLWRSDHQCPANFDVEASQCHHLCFSSWMPYSGSGAGRAYDEYRIRSCYDVSMSTNYSFSERDTFCDTEEKVAFIKKYTQEYLKVRPYFTKDFYPLTEVSDRLDTWCAAQFDRPDEHDGIVQVFRREASPYETARFFLRGIEDGRTYRFTDADGGEFTVNGTELSQNGLVLTIPEQRKAKIYFYKAI